MDDLPFVREFQLCSRFGWSWEACQRTPQLVKDVFYLYLTIESWVHRPPRGGAS